MLWESGGAAGAGSGAAATPPPAAATPPPAGGAPPPSGTGTPAPGAAGASGAAGTTAPPPAAGTFTYPEDRSTWVRPDLHKKAESLVNRTTSELANARRDIATLTSQIAALTGIKPPATAAESEAEKVAAAFFAIPQFAHLKNITPELLGRIARLVEQEGSLTEARDHIYNQQADRFLAQLETDFAAEIGADKLTPGQARKLRAAFGAAMPNAEDDPEAFRAFKQRYDSGDTTLIADFIKEYTADMLEPARRQATVPFGNRRPVPRGGGSTAVTTTTQKPDYSKMTITEMLEHGEKQAEALGR